jgi:hypothetical protein
MTNLSNFDSLANNARRALTSALALAALLSPAAASAAEDHSGWSWNFTPVLILPKGDHHLGGGVDPELQYTLDQGLVRWSAGFRIGGYYAYDMLGVTTMPTGRVSVPLGPVEPYASFGMGYGWLPQAGERGVATLSRLGIIFHFSDRLAVGVEGSLQNIYGTDFHFPSLGSMVSFDL